MRAASPPRQMERENEMIVISHRLFFFSVKIKEGNCTVHPEFIETPDCIITALASVYEDVELGRLGPEIAIMSGKMKISNLGAMMGFVKLFHRITNS